MIASPFFSLEYFSFKLFSDNNLFFDIGVSWIRLDNIIVVAFWLLHGQTFLIYISYCTQIE